MARGNIKSKVSTRRGDNGEVMLIGCLLWNGGCTQTELNSSLAS